MKIALGQINPTVGDFSGNARRIVDNARRARESGAGLVIFPELSICGYPPRDLVEKPAFVSRNQEVLEQMGGKFVLNISASPFLVGKRELRREMLAAIAKRYHVPVVMVNQVGGNDQLIFDGSSLVLNREGEVIAQGASFREDLVFFDS